MLFDRFLWSRIGVILVLLICSVKGSVAKVCCVDGSDAHNTFVQRHLEKRTIQIVAFGNSITAPRPSVDQVFAQRLPALLAARGIDATVINAGVGGSHTGKLEDNNFTKVKHALDRFDEDVLTHHPDVVIIGFGTNDAYIDSGDPNGPSRISLPKYRENLSYMIESLQQRGIKVILVAPSPLAAPRPDFQNERLYQYVKEVRRLSKKYRTGLADNHKLFKNYKHMGKKYETLLPDGVHPNDEGHRIIAENMCNQLSKLLRNAN